MARHFQVAQDLIAPHGEVSTLKLHLHQFFLDFLFDINKLWLLALHGALTRLLVEFFKTFMMISLLTGLTFHRVDQDGLTKSTEVLWF